MRMTRNLVNLRTGRTAASCATAPTAPRRRPGRPSTPWPSIIGGCATRAATAARSSGPRPTPGGHRPRTAWEAMTLIPQNPQATPGDLRAGPGAAGVPPGPPPGARGLGAGPPVRRQRARVQRPGNVAFDRHGAVWVINNAQWAKKWKNVCPGLGLFKVDPFARPPGRAVHGGSINGAGFGVGFDPDNHLWIGNFGFSGKRCTTEPTSNSLSEFRLDGETRSPRRAATGRPAGAGRRGRVRPGRQHLDRQLRQQHPGRVPGRRPTSGDGGRHRDRRAFDVAVKSPRERLVTANQGTRSGGFTPDGGDVRLALRGRQHLLRPLGIASDRLATPGCRTRAPSPVPCKSGEGP